MTRRSTLYPENFTSHVPKINYGLLDELVGYNIRRAQIVIYADFHRSINDEAITPQRFATLVIISENHSLRQVQLGKVLGIARPGVTAIVDFWEKRNAVKRIENPNDRRSYGLILTKEGEQIVQALKNIIRAHEERITKNLTEKEVNTLITLLNKVTGDSTP